MKLMGRLQMVRNFPISEVFLISLPKRLQPSTRSKNFWSIEVRSNPLMLLCELECGFPLTFGTTAWNICTACTNQSINGFCFCVFTCALCAELLEDRNSCLWNVQYVAALAFYRELIGPTLIRFSTRTWQLLPVLTSHKFPASSLKSRIP